eukprot:1254331-Prymnesium_polylepis.1
MPREAAALASRHTRASDATQRTGGATLGADRTSGMCLERACPCVTESVGILRFVSDATVVSSHKDYLLERYSSILEHFGRTASKLRETAIKDKTCCQRTAVDPTVTEWIDRQPKEVKQKWREFKGKVLSDEWWHMTEVFTAVTEPVTVSLRCLDTGKPNLKDAAFAFEQLRIEYGEPLLGKL